MLPTFAITEILFYALMVIGILYLSKRRRPKSFPPGPVPLPIIGNLHQFGKEPHKTFMKMGEKYGSVIGVDFGAFRGIVINDPKLIKECFNMPECSGRPRLGPFVERCGGSFHGIVFSEGNSWVEQRRFALKNLRDFGFAKKSMETLMHDEIKDLLESFRESKGKPISTKQKFNIAVLNALWIICTGDRLNHNDPRLHKVLKSANQAFESSGVADPFLFLPTLSKLMPELMGYNKFVKMFHEAVEFVTEVIDERKKSYVIGSDDRDLMDVYLKKMNETSDPSSAFYKDEGEQNTLMAFTDLFQAGSETTSTALTWFFLLLALHPEVQEKFHSEIMEYIGDSRLPVLEDKKSMIYTEALILEALRYAVIIPLGVYHNTTEEVIIDGYIIPKNTLIAPNQYAALKDPKIWGDPQNFRPERFILPNGSIDKHNVAFIPFSTGKRVCIGETFAMDQLFLFSVSMIQQFRVSTDPSKPRPTTAHYPGLVLNLKPHELIFNERS